MRAAPMVVWTVAAGIVAAVAARPSDGAAGGRRTALVVHVGNDPADLARFERWLGCPVDGVAIHTGQAGWDDWSGSVGFQLLRWSGARRKLYWSVPLIPEGATLARAAAGAYDARYARAARDIAAGTSGGGTIDVRTGWEFNTSHMPWSSHGREREYVAAFGRFVDAFRSVSPRFRFEWTPNIGGADDPALSYPGDGRVDVIGMDAYYDRHWDPGDARVAWMRNVRRPYGFGWLEAFARTRAKPTAYAEWAVMSPDAAAYVDRAAAWFRHGRALYQSYWNSNSSFRGKLSDGAMPRVGAAFRSAFASCRKRGF